MPSYRSRGTAPKIRLYARIDEAAYKAAFAIATLDNLSVSQVVEDALLAHGERRLAGKDIERLIARAETDQRRRIIDQIAGDS